MSHSIMKYFTCLLLILGLTATLSSCLKDEDGTAATVTGNWTLVNDSTIINS